MCGIAGQFCFSDYRGHVATLRNMLISNQIRGRDAAGVAYMVKDRVTYLKAKGEPRDFADKILTPELWKAVARSSVVLLHARGASQGKPEDNVNNHPVVAADWVVTHNGRVHNDDDLLAYYGMTDERPAAVDTVAINLTLAQGETALESLGHASLLNGPATFAAFSLKNPKELILARISGGQPIYINWLGAPYNILFWSSDPDGLRHTAVPVLGGLGATNVTVLPNNQALVINRDGVKRYELNNLPFKMPYVPKRGKQLPLAQAEGARHSDTGTKPKITTGSKAVKGPSTLMAVQSIMEKWFADPSKTDTTFVTLGTAAEMKGLFNYIKLGKPEPLFETDMIGLALNPPGGTDVPTTGRFLRTPYGTWSMYPKARVFKPMKRIRRHWLLNVEKPLKLEVKFPANAKLQIALHEAYQLEGVKIKEIDGSVWGVLMCPWCGIMSKHSVWSEWQYECAWCQITSPGERKAAV